jgi:DNA replicative helicase MCM subunit Mcm2 (Cdc46/Mcm family)
MKASGLFNYYFKSLNYSDITPEIIKKYCRQYARLRCNEMFDEAIEKINKKYDNKRNNRP